jgi:hypothetical protein
LVSQNSWQAGINIRFDLDLLLHCHLAPVEREIATVDVFTTRQ